MQLKKALRSSGVTSGTDDFKIGRAPRTEENDTLSPTESDRRFVVEALEKTLGDPDSNKDIISSCMISLGKIGLDPGILEKFKEYLASKDQEISETATLAMGIANFEEADEDLLSIANDESRGRKLVRRNRVPFRTRSFACYSLGLIGYATKDHGVKRKIWQGMRKLIEDENLNNRDIQVAALQAIRLLRPSQGSKVGTKLTQDVVEFLLDYLARERVNKQVQSHAFTALAELVGRGDRYDKNGELRNFVTKVIQDRRRKSWIHQSAVLALGQMGTPEDLDLCKALQTYMMKGRNQQAKNFCAISLGQIGGTSNRDFLIEKLRQRRTKTLLKPWIALGLGVLEFRKLAKNPYDVSTAASKSVVLQALKRENNRITAAAYAISLGLMRAKDAEDLIVDRMRKYRNTSESAGYMALSLGLLNADAMTEINEILDRSSHFEDLMIQASIALGLLGDKEVGEKLLSRMKDPGNGLSVQSAIAQALGFIGDKRSIRPLVGVMRDAKSYMKIPRAFAAAALGLICDKEELPWNSKISRNINYRANTETLTGSGSGILEIL